MKKIAIIPARSGSKGLKDKNIMTLCGKPLLAYSIEAATKTNAFERVIVSTDSSLYKEIAEQYGAEVLMRGEEISNDTATTYSVLKDIFERIERQDYDYFVLLQPTSPLRNNKHVSEAINEFEDNYDKFNFLVSVKEAEHVSDLVKQIEDDGSLKYFDLDFSNYRRQKGKEYSPNGAIFIGKIEDYLEQKHFFGEKSKAYFMSKEDSVDVDDFFDFKIANICIITHIILGH